MTKEIKKSKKLADVCYDIRGPVLDYAKKMEEEGTRIIKLNIGNTAPFGFLAPDEVIKDIIVNLQNASGYADSKGIFPARKAIMQYSQEKNLPNVTMEDIYIGNGVSELIVMSMQALIDDGDEVLIPAPDYPLWTAAVSLAGGRPVHYLCDEENFWYPDIAHIKKSITEKTKAIVVINPNNPTGTVYPQEYLQQIVDIARENNLIIFSDEIYDKIIYDNEPHISIASLASDLFCITMNGLSKSYRACGYRTGWMVLSGPKEHAQGYIEGLNILASMRLCANVPAQYAIQTALGGYQSVNELIAPEGRWYKQRELAYELLTKIPGVSVVRPKAALYMFVKLDPVMYPITNDQDFIFELLKEEKVLLVQGTGFNWVKPDHFRLVFLPNTDELKEAIERIANFLDRLRKLKSSFP